MPEQRRRFSPQLKAEAVQTVIETGRPIAVVARELGVHDGTLGNWVNVWRRELLEPDQPVNLAEPGRDRYRRPPVGPGRSGAPGIRCLAGHLRLPADRRCAQP